MSKWWKNKVIYQIYPKSFMDSNGDGIGDIKGIISKLDYLKELGVDIIWISPMYESPFVDQGYDISDYYKLADCFGTMEDFDELIAEVKKRDMYVIMDLVINHCSDQHEWFKKAIANPSSEYGEYFYFEKGKDNMPPSNYRSYFGGNMWEKVPNHENLYYLHSFAKQQPDLNWNNPVVLDKLYDMVNWWLEKGVSGFRIDAIINIKKDTEFPSYEVDGPDGLCSVEKIVKGALASTKEKSIGTLLNDLKVNTFEKYDAFTVGEVFNMNEDELNEFIGDNGHFSTIFWFGLHLLTNCEAGWFASKEVTFNDIRKSIFEAQLANQNVGMLSNVIENHDQPRGINVFIPNWIDRENGCKLLATVMYFLYGIPCIYQGQEIGMTNNDFKSIDDFNDISTIDQYNQCMSHGMSAEEAFLICKRYSRDNARTPMHWNSSDNGGFSTGQPWFVMNSNYPEINVLEQQNRADSVLNYYKALLKFRKNLDYEDAIVYGNFKPICEKVDNVLAYERKGDKHTICVVSNWGQHSIKLGALLEGSFNLLLSYDMAKDKAEKYATNGSNRNDLEKLDYSKNIIINNDYIIESGEAIVIEKVL